MKCLQFNKRATFNYTIEKSIICGMSLLSKEVKPIRSKKFTLNNAFVINKQGILYLTHYIVPDRFIPLLMTKKQVDICISYLSLKGFTLIPIKIFNSDNNLLKVEICIAKGASNYDKRHKIKARDERRRNDNIINMN